jgi:ABC-type antimicrobial peptide transport system permease subunit
MILEIFIGMAILVGIGLGFLFLGYVGKFLFDIKNIEEGVRMKFDFESANKGFCLVWGVAFFLGVLSFLIFSAIMILRYLYESPLYISIPIFSVLIISVMVWILLGVRK